MMAGWLEYSGVYRVHGDGGRRVHNYLGCVALRLRFELGVRHLLEDGSQACLRHILAGGRLRWHDGARA